MGAIYEADLALWAKEQAELLRRRDSNAIDWDHVARRSKAWAVASGVRSDRGWRSCSPISYQMAAPTRSPEQQLASLD